MRDEYIPQRMYNIYLARALGRVWAACVLGSPSNNGGIVRANRSFINISDLSGALLYATELLLCSKMCSVAVCVCLDIYL